MDRQKRYDEWQTIIDRQQESGLAELKFCQRENLNYPRFRYYKERLKKKSVKSASGNKKQFAVVNIENKNSNFGTIKIIFPNEIECRLPGSMGSILMKRLFEEGLTC